MKRDVIKHFLNIDNVPDARLFTGNSFHSRGSAAPNAEPPIRFFVMPITFYGCRCYILRPIDHEANKAFYSAEQIHIN